MRLFWFLGLYWSIPLGVAMSFLYVIVVSLFRGLSRGDFNLKLDFSTLSATDWMVICLIMLGFALFGF